MSKLKRRIADWIYRRKIDWKLWLQRNILMAALGFMGFNAVDGYLTNSIQRGLEANPVLAPIAGHWGLSFKGILGLAAIGAIDRVRKYRPNLLFYIAMAGSFAFAGVLIWNLHVMGWLKW